MSSAPFIRFGIRRGQAKYSLPISVFDKILNSISLSRDNPSVHAAVYDAVGWQVPDDVIFASMTTQVKSLGASTTAAYQQLSVIDPTITGHVASVLPLANKAEVLFWLERMHAFVSESDVPRDLRDGPVEKWEDLDGKFNYVYHRILALWLDVESLAKEQVAKARDRLRELWQAGNKSKDGQDRKLRLNECLRQLAENKERMKKLHDSADVWNT